MNTTYLPPEWAKQKAILLTWPHSHSDWASMIVQVDKTYLEMAEAISHSQRIIITCFDKSHRRHIRRILENSNSDLGNIMFFESPSNDCWIRDHGPISIFRNNRLELLDFTFNGWGNKFDASFDNCITRNLHEQGAFNSSPLISLDYVLEGGSIEVDGKGGLLTSASCLLAPTRNPGRSQAHVEALLHHELGIERFYWLHQGCLIGDDTDGHIDTLARFTDEHTIVYSTCLDPLDEQFTSLNSMKQELSQLRDYKDNPFELIPLPIPKAIYDNNGNRLPANYTNFLIINNAVLMPVYNDPMDDIAQKVFSQCFRNRKIIGIDSLTLIQQAGSIHCATMQLPVRL